MIYITINLFVMLKHKIIVTEQFKKKERIREHLGIERVNTIYQKDNDQEEVEEKPSPITQENFSSASQQVFCFQGFFGESEDQAQRCGYNPYDFLFNSEGSEPEEGPPNPITLLNTEYMQKMTVDCETPIHEKKVSFDDRIIIKYYNEESAPSDIAKQEQYEINRDYS